MTDKFSPPRHNKAAHSALSSPFFPPSHPPLLPVYPSSHLALVNPRPRLLPPPLLRRHETPFISTLLPAQTRFKLPLEISFPPFQSPENRFLPKKELQWGYQLARTTHARCRALWHHLNADREREREGKVRKKRRRVEEGTQCADEYAHWGSKEVTLLTYRDHFVDMVDVLENCSLPGWLASKLFHWLTVNGYLVKRSWDCFLTQRLRVSKINFFFIIIFVRDCLLSIRQTIVPYLQDLPEIKNI